MPKKVPLAASTRHILLYDEDWAYIESRFGPRGFQPIGVSAVIRAIVHQKVLALRASEIEAQDQAHRRGDPSPPIRVSGGISPATVSLSPVLTEE